MLLSRIICSVCWCMLAMQVTGKVQRQNSLQDPRMPAGKTCNIRLPPATRAPRRQTWTCRRPSRLCPSTTSPGILLASLVVCYVIHTSYAAAEMCPCRLHSGHSLYLVLKPFYIFIQAWVAALPLQWGFDAVQAQAKEQQEQAQAQEKVWGHQLCGIFLLAPCLDHIHSSNCQSVW